MENKNKPAYPIRGANGVPFTTIGHEGDFEEWTKQAGATVGLTKREVFVMAAMQGLVSNRTLIGDYIGMETKIQFSEMVSKEAIRIADELLRQLEL